ncbi:hypothetical protein GCM10027403_34570 [Arthrobacter tecti]
MEIVLWTAVALYWVLALLFVAVIVRMTFVWFTRRYLPERSKTPLQLLPINLGYENESPLPVTRPDQYRMLAHLSTQRQTLFFVNAMAVGMTVCCLLMAHGVISENRVLFIFALPGGLLVGLIIAFVLEHLYHATMPVESFAMHARALMAVANAFEESSSMHVHHRFSRSCLKFVSSAGRLGIERTNI